LTFNLNADPKHSHRTTWDYVTQCVLSETFYNNTTIAGKKSCFTAARNAHEPPTNICRPCRCDMRPSVSRYRYFSRNYSVLFGFWQIKICYRIYLSLLRLGLHLIFMRICILYKQRKLFRVHSSYSFNCYRT
jgi:hypothetical protein